MSHIKKDFLYEAIKHNMEFLYNTAKNFDNRYKRKNFDSFDSKTKNWNFFKKSH